MPYHKLHHSTRYNYERNIAQQCTSNILKVAPSLETINKPSDTGIKVVTSIFYQHTTHNSKFLTTYLSSKNTTVDNLEFMEPISLYVMLI